MFRRRYTGIQLELAEMYIPKKTDCRGHFVEKRHEEIAEMNTPLDRWSCDVVVAIPLLSSTMVARRATNLA